jgi:DNA-binding CsgD family transcriptional regulator
MGMAPGVQKNGRRVWTDDELGFIQSPPRGWTNQDIGEYLERSPKTVKTYRQKLRNGWSPERHMWTEEFLDAIRASAGRHREDVAAELDCSLSTVKNARTYLRMGGHLPKGRCSPSSVADRPLLAKTCVECGLLWGGAHFNQTPGRGYDSRCYRCKNARYRKPESRTAAKQRAYVAAMEAATESMATPEKPYQSSRRQPWTEADVAMLERRDLTTPQIAAALGRSWLAVNSACHSYGVKRPTERVSQLPTGEWRIDFPTLEEIAA